MEILTDPTFNKLPGIKHAFFTRKGGVSTGIYASLNCAYASKDSTENIKENRRRAMSYIHRPAESLLTLKDIHRLCCNLNFNCY